MTSTHSGPWSAARYDLTAEIFEMITIGYKLSGNFCTHSSCFFAEMISSQTIQRRENNVLKIVLNFAVFIPKIAIKSKTGLNVCYGWNIYFHNW